MILELKVSVQKGGLGMVRDGNSGSKRMEARQTHKTRLCIMTPSIPCQNIWRS